MKVGSGELENSENSSFGDTFAEFYRNSITISNDNGKSPALKISLRQTFVCEHSVDVSRLLAGAQTVVNFIYASDKCDRKLRGIPEDVRAAMHYSSIAALLFRFGKKNRQRIKPDPAYALIFGKCVDYRQDGTMHLIHEGVTLPQPPITDDFEVLKVSFCCVYADRVELICLVAAPPFNIASVPIAEYTDDMPMLTDADFPKGMRKRKRKERA